jgi:hypothetical protein
MGCGRFYGYISRDFLIASSTLLNKAPVGACLQFLQVIWIEIIF